MSPNVEIPQLDRVEHCAMLLLAGNHNCFDPSIALQLACPLEILGTNLLLASPEHPLSSEHHPIQNMTILAMTIFKESGIGFPQLNCNPLIPTLSLNQLWVPHLLLSADETPKAKGQGNFFPP